MAKELYNLLGVSENATDDEIKKAFRKQARVLHPDVNKESDAEEKFKQINEAYEVLGDPQKRSYYDRFGTIPGAAGGGGAPVDFEDLFGGSGMGDIFSAFFGGMGGAGRAQMRKEGRDMGVGLRLTLEEAAAGVKKEIVYDRLAPCSDCGGSGLGPDGKEGVCPDCNGQGRVVIMQRTFLGDMQSATTCRSCGGTGKTIENPCPECEGQGRVPEKQRLTVEIPPGIRDGQQLRLSDYGEAGMNGAPSGALIVTCRILSHEYFERDGNDLHVQASISMVQAALGSEMEIDGIFEDEIVEIRVPEGCQNGQVIRVRDHGMPRFRSEKRGDLFVHAEVVIPKQLSKRQRELLEELAVEMNEEVSEARTPLQKLRDVFG